MALPELTAPPGTPHFLAAGHAQSRDSVYAHFEPSAGHARKRRRYTAADGTLAVSWWLDAEQMAAVDAWAEDALQAFNAHFAAQIANLGPGTVWVEAQWAAPYTATPQPLGRWRVSGTLWLFGEPSADPPVATSLALAISVPLVADLVVEQQVLLALDIVVALEVPTGLALSIEVALTADLDVTQDVLLALAIVVALEVGPAPDVPAPEPGMPWWPRDGEDGEDGFGMQGPQGEHGADGAPGQLVYLDGQDGEDGYPWMPLSDYLTVAEASAALALKMDVSALPALLPGNYPYAGLPAAASVIAGTEAVVNDIGAARARTFSNGTYWLLRAPTDVVRDVATANGTLSGIEQLLKAATLPIGLLRAGRSFSIKVQFAHTGSTDAATTCTIRFGAAGTTADLTLLSTALLTAGNRTLSVESTFFLNTATQLRPLGSPALLTAWPGIATTIAANAPITIPDADSTALIVSAWMDMSGTTDTPQCPRLIVTIWP